MNFSFECLPVSTFCCNVPEAELELPLSKISSSCSNFLTRTWPSNSHLRPLLPTQAIAYFRSLTNLGLIYAILSVLEAAVDRFIALPVLLSRYDLSPEDLEALCCSPANPSS